MVRPPLLSSSCGRRRCGRGPGRPAGSGVRSRRRRRRACPGSRCGACSTFRPSGCFVQLLGGRGRDDVELGHPVEHHVAARDGTVLVAGRVEADRVLHQAGEGGGLQRVELVGVDREEVPGGGLDAVGAVAEVGEVEVALEDPVLGVVLLEGDRVAELLDLALVGVRGGRLALGLGVRLRQQCHLGHLLGDRGTALGAAAGGLVVHEGAQRALQVQGAVLVEAVVLDRDDRRLHDRRDLVEGHVDAVLVVEGRDRVAVAVQHPAALGERGRLQLLGEVLHRLRRWRWRRIRPRRRAGSTSPAARTPTTAETATMTPRWERTVPNVRWGRRRGIAQS